MVGDKKLFEMMRKRGQGAGQLPVKVIRFIPDENADAVLAIDARIQQIRKHMPVIMGGCIGLAFLIGVCV